MVIASSCAGAALESVAINHVAADFVQHGWAIGEEFCPRPELNGLAEEARRLWEQGQFHQSGIGRGAARQRNSAIRGDYTLWLDAAVTPQACQFVARELELLRRTLNATAYLGLFEFEGHLAVYPPGASYARHVDQLQGSGERCISVVLYLNRDWQAQDGGELWLYPSHPAASRVAVLPTSGTLAVFTSSSTPHEVRPATRPRFSLSGWFRHRA